MNVGSLFAGIGGFDLGFERCGMRTVWQVEQNAYCRAVLAQHFPDAQRFEDVCEVGAAELEPVDLICGGFPCQDISLAGKGAGLDGARSGLWSEYARIVRELEPRYVVVENVSALLGRGLDRVLRDLAALGYDAEWDCLPASAFGAPHRRDRLWLVAYPAEPRPQGLRADSGQSEVPQPRHGGALADSEGERREPRPGTSEALPAGQSQAVESEGRSSLPANRGPSPYHWLSEPDVGRVADGVPARVDRLAALGNALVPQIAEWIGRRIIDYEREHLMSQLSIEQKGG